MIGEWYTCKGLMKGIGSNLMSLILSMLTNVILQEISSQLGIGKVCYSTALTRWLHGAELSLCSMIVSVCVRTLLRDFNVNCKFFGVHT